MNNKVLNQYYKIARQSDLFRSYYSGFPNYLDAPLVGKKELIHQLTNHFDLNNQSKGVYLVRSGGSTQKPLVFPVDIAENMEQRAVLANALNEAGIFVPTTIALNFFGYMDMYRTAAIMDDLLERCSATTLVAGASLPYEDAYHMAQNFRPDFLLGTPSKLILFANYLKAHKLKLSIKNLLFGGEFLPYAHIETFRTALGTDQIYSLYGSAETGIWAWCDYNKLPSLFRVIAGLVVEVNMPDAEGYGSLLVSNLFRKRFPVFRYNTGDVGRWREIDGISYLELKGRESRSFMLNESNYELDDFSSVFAGVNQFQIQIGAQAGRTSLKFMLLTALSDLDRPDFIQQKYQQLYTVFGYPVKNMEVFAGMDLQFYTDETTGKTPVIIDWRV